MLDAMRACGASEDDIEAVRQAQQVGAPPPEPQSFEVYHDNWQTVQVFLRCATQWDYVSGGVMGPGGGYITARRTGMKYAGVDVVVNRHVPRRRQKEVWDGLQIMERSVLTTDARLREAQQ